MRFFHEALIVGVSVWALGCGDDEKKSEPEAEDKGCSVAEQTGCEEEQVCEETTGGEPACYDPVSIGGKVFDTSDGAGIEGARVVVRDANGAVVTDVAITDAEGDYSLRVPARRNEDGTPEASTFTLRADAQDYLPFPQAPRVALPVTLESADDDGVVSNPTTEIGMIPTDATGTGSISGTVEGEGVGGTLVVAGALTGVADAAGTYTIFNVPPGTVAVQAYRQGFEYTPTSADVSAGEDTEGVDLALAGETTSVVSGQLQFANAPGAPVTSVILAVADTFVEATGRGEAPFGLRAEGVTGAWEIAGVPDGKYVVLASFENDNLVRDPDTSIGGTELVTITVEGADLPIAESFKVTGALDVFTPKADQIEELSADGLVFEWEDDSSEDGYLVQLFDALGTQVWSTEGDFDPGGSKPASVAYDGPGLEAGMYYQLRATSIKDGVPISRTEDLEGVFIAR